MLPVSEVFGPTIQGEGPRAGRLSWFIRLGGCNLSCSWCDTPYTWDGRRYNLRAEMTQTSVPAILERIPNSVRDVVITGGEPLLHQGNSDWLDLLNGLLRKGALISVETNGTISPNFGTRAKIGHFSISPKLPNAHNNRHMAELASWPRESRHRAILKFVVEDAADVALAVSRADAAGWPRDSLWMMPEGTSAEILLKRWPEICDAALTHGVNACQRLHVLAWGNERGR